MIPLLTMGALKAIETTLTPDGRINLDGLSPLAGPTRVILTLLESDDEAIDLAKASEQALARDWNRDEEEQAWAYLQEETSS